MLSSVTMPDRITGPHGSLDFGPDHARLAALLTPEHRDIVGAYLTERGLRADGINRPATYIDHGEPQTIPWWWLFSGAFLSGVVDMYGLEVIAEGATPRGNGHTVLARVPEESAATSATSAPASRGLGVDDWDHRTPGR